MKRFSCIQRTGCVFVCQTGPLTRFGCVALFVAWLVVGQPTVEIGQAREPVAEFLATLQARGEFTLAERYLDQLSTSYQLLTPGEREELGYFRGVLLLSQAERESRSARQRELAQQATEALQDFIRLQPQHELAGSAHIRWGELELWQARQSLRQNGTEESVRKAQAAQKILAAQQHFIAGQQLVKQQIKALPPGIHPQRNPLQFKLRRRWEAEYLKSLMSQAIAELEVSDLAIDSEERERRLDDALTQFQTISTKYRLRLEAAAARWYIAQCHLRRKESPQALGYLTELLEARSTNPGVLQLQTRALALAMDLWMQQDPPASITMIRYGEAWLTAVGKNLSAEPESLQIQLRLAQAYHAESQNLSEGDASDRETLRLRVQARRWAQRVAQSSGPHQSAAEELTRQLGAEATPVKELSAADLEWKEPQTAEESLQYARLWLSQLEELSKKEALKSGPTVSHSGVTADDDSTDAETSKESLQQSRKIVSEFSRRALQRAHVLSSDPKIRQEARALRAFWELREGNALEAAILSTYVMRSHPDTQSARDCGPIALSAWTLSHQEANAAAKPVVEAHLTVAAEFLAKNWSGQGVANRATLVVAKLRVNQGKYEEAESWIDRLPAESASRRAARLFLGQVMLDHYQKSPADTRSDQLLQRGLVVLQEAWNELHSQPVSIDTIRTALLIASARQDADPEAVESLLRDPVHGPLTLLEQRHPILMQNTSLSNATYQLALREAVHRLRSGTPNPENVQHCITLLNDILALPADSPHDAESRIPLYASLAHDAGALMAHVTPQQKADLGKALLEAFRGFVSESQDPQQLAWISAALHQLVAPLRDVTTDGSDSVLTTPDIVKDILLLAVATDEILVKSFEDASVDDPARNVPRLQAGQRLAGAYVELHRYEDAIRTYGSLLKSAPQFINLQVLAAKTYQEWGDSGATDRYREAMEGGLPDASGKPTLWGWALIAATTSRSDQHQDVMLEARIHLSECRLAAARTKRGDDRLTLLRAAKRDVRMTPLLVPAAAQAPWRSRYDQLLREIQKELGEVVSGLPTGTTPTAHAGRAK
ncbi:MAG: hypothetical protein O2931_02610 [Planctomycetota bacterium]|nr:hypothetical protein [Planctomycetota bacterium]MDA1177667.1 hypothetical protein [Planctomycetota bacterium]